MQLNERYKMEIVILEKTISGIGDCCDCLETFQKEHLSSDFSFGYVIIDKKTGYIPNQCKDWHKTPEAAMLEFVSKIMKK